VAEVIRGEIEGPVAIEPAVHGDERGFLVETYSEPTWREAGVEGPFVQENHSRSTRRGTLRGMHFQTEPGQGKLVRCARGEIFDVAVDLRRGSPTFGRWEGHVLDDRRHRQLWVPIGFAHGFQVLSEVADVAYKLTSLYDPETESEVAWDDPEVGIEWPLADPLLSARDQAAPPLAEVAGALPFRFG
jgi:dTDP-4-dehydrorhamnose 3,5-epimerase